LFYYLTEREETKMNRTILNLLICLSLIVVALVASGCPADAPPPPPHHCGECGVSDATPASAAEACRDTIEWGGGKHPTTQAECEARNAESKLPNAVIQIECCWKPDVEPTPPAAGCEGG
jgi:hypothetical protein